MKHSLQNHLAITYTVFVTAAIAVLTLAINIFTGITFTNLIKENIAGKSEEIVRLISELYKPIGDFDRAAIEAIGMYFVHEGYIVSVKDARGEQLWNAFYCDMQQCIKSINDIVSRMEGQFGLKGELRRQEYPIYYKEKKVGSVFIETYGPFFYSETETRFLSSINKLLFIAGLVLALLSTIIAVVLSRSIARPILRAAEAARTIALHSEKGIKKRPCIRVPQQYEMRELHDLSSSINELAFKLEEAERRQMQLSSDIAHELRTPLTCLQGNVEAMVDGVYEPDKENLLSCHEEILRLIRLVEDLNTLTGFEFETIKLNKSSFDLAKLIGHVAEQFKAAAYDKGIVLDLNLVESPIEADYDRLKQVFMNLFSNAFKYTDSGVISVFIESGGCQWHVSISDTGIGISEADIPYIFERFYRTDKSRSRSTGGSGIGLAIVCAIISAHEGSISAENASKVGATFHIYLPAGPAQGQPCTHKIPALLEGVAYGFLPTR